MAALWIAPDLDYIGLTTQQVCKALNVSRGTWTGWVTKGLAPKPDDRMDSKPIWTVNTIFEYVRNAPGGQLGYKVG